MAGTAVSSHAINVKHEALGIDCLYSVCCVRYSLEIYVPWCYYHVSGFIPFISPTTILLSLCLTYFQTKEAQNWLIQIKSKLIYNTWKSVYELWFLCFCCLGDIWLVDAAGDRLYRQPHGDLSRGSSRGRDGGSNASGSTLPQLERRPAHHRIYCHQGKRENIMWASTQ